MLLTWILLYRVCCVCFLPVHLPTHFTMIAPRVKIRQPVLGPIILTTMPHAQQTFNWTPLLESHLRVIVCTLFTLTKMNYCMQWAKSLKKPPRAEYSWVPLSVISFCALERRGPRAPPNHTVPPRSPADTFIRLDNTLARWQFSWCSKAPPEKRSETVTSQSHT